MRFARAADLVSAPRLKIVNPDDDAAALGAIVKAAGLDAGIVVEATMATHGRLSEGDTGSVGGRVKLRIFMFDTEGRAIWRDTIEGNSEDLTRVSGGTYTFPTEIVKVVAAAFERASEEAVERLKVQLP